MKNGKRGRFFRRCEEHIQRLGELKKPDYRSELGDRQNTKATNAGWNMEKAACR